MELMTRRERIDRIIDWFEQDRRARELAALFRKHGTNCLTDEAQEEYARRCIGSYKFTQKLNRENRDRAAIAKATGGTP